jgi:hypothetical protein
VAILTAREPDQPDPPTTTRVDHRIRISWKIPYDGSSPITSYTIKIRHNDGFTYSEESTNCNGKQDTDIIINHECFVLISDLSTAPYHMTWGDSIFAKVTATNAIGDSVESGSGNGALLITYPDAPVDLQNVPSVTNATQIGISWGAPPAAGGSVILDYTVSIGVHSGSYTQIVSNVEEREYTIKSLPRGITLKFKVQARSEYGLSTDSNEVFILAA